MESFAWFQLAALLIGLAAGVLAARRGWDATPGLIGALGVFVLVMLLGNLAQELSMGAVIGAVALGPAVGIVPVAAGFFGGRWAAARLLQRGDRLRGRPASSRVGRPPP